jgi:hypothetical protein
LDSRAEGNFEIFRDALQASWGWNFTLLYTKAAGVWFYFIVSSYLIPVPSRYLPLCFFGRLCLIDRGKAMSTNTVEYRFIIYPESFEENLYRILGYQS